MRLIDRCPATTPLSPAVVIDVILDLTVVRFFRMVRTVMPLVHLHVLAPSARPSI